MGGRLLGSVHMRARVLQNRVVGTKIAKAGFSTERTTTKSQAAVMKCSKEDLVETVTFPNPDRGLHSEDQPQSCPESEHPEDDSWEAWGIGAQIPPSPECVVEPASDIGDGLKASIRSVGNEEDDGQAEDCSLSSVELVWCHSNDGRVGTYYWMNKARTWCNRSVELPRQPPPPSKDRPLRKDFAFGWEPVDPQ